MYQVLARKWRPQIFEELVGQKTVTQTLKNAIDSKRIAHAFLFSGPRGSGKTSCARILAKALNCHSFPEPAVDPCNKCPSCQDITASRSLDVLEIDGASNRGIDEVRTLRETAKYQPMRDRYRIFIIDEVHMLTAEAFNALLKILEEPPQHVFFIFATTEFRKVPTTITSRCQPFDFKRIPNGAVIDRLRYIAEKEKIEISSKSLEMIALASEGALRDALGTLDQAIAFSGSTIKEKDVESLLGLVDLEVMIKLGESICRGDSAAVLSILDRVSEYGLDYKVFYSELLAFFRDLFLLRFAKSPAESQDPALQMSLQKLASQYEEIQLLRICHQLVSTQHLIRLSGNLRFLFEIMLVKLCQLKHLVPIEEVVESLKKKEDVSRVIPKKTSTVSTAKTTSKPAEITGSSVEPYGDDFLALLVSDLESRNPRLAAVLGNASFQRTDSRISFFVPEKFYRGLEERDRTDLQDLLHEKLGTRVPVEILKGEAPLRSSSKKVTTPESLIEKDPIIRQFVKTFEGKINEIQLNKERYR